MKSKLVILFVGIIIGYTAHLFDRRFVEEIEPQREPARASVPEIKAAPIAKSGASSIMIAEKRTPHVNELIQKGSNPEATPSPQGISGEPELVGLRLDEISIQTLEEQRERLRQFAYARETSEGWKVYLSKQDQLFRQAGIKSGDLITYESINRQLADPQTSQLASRMVEILKTIERN